VDHEGNDRYIPQNGSGLGFAVHLSNAIVIDRSGNDYYFAKTHSGGVGSDRSTALLIDYAGDDIYGPSEVFVTEELKKSVKGQSNQPTAEEIHQQAQAKLADVSYGSALKPKALGFLIDFAGDDHYFARQNGWGESLGGVMPPVEPDDWSYAFLIDLNGTDIYGKSGRRDNHYATYFNHGLCYDIEYSGSTDITRLQLPALQRNTPETNPALKPFVHTASYADVQDLLKPDLFVRYQALGRLNRTTPVASGDYIRILSTSTDTELNRDLLEALVIRIINRQFRLRRSLEFDLLLSARDPYVRRFAARTLGRFRVKRAVSALIAAWGEETNEIRSDFIWALGRMDSAEAIGHLITVVRSDPDISSRRSAVEALSHLMRQTGDADPALSSKSKELFVAMLTDPDEVIRTLAAQALKRFGNAPDIITSLKHSLNDSSVYVQRAAANSLALNGIKAGIPVLIETLRYPSIDTFEHYDHDLITTLSYYAGVDFPEEKRYNYHTWQSWWQENGSELNLQQNLDIMKKIVRAFSAPNEELGISIFEKLIDEHPHNVVVKKRYQRFCYEWITYRLLTQENVSEDILKRCLRIQKIAVALKPDDPQAMASLAYFQVRLNKFSEAIATIQKAIQLDPDNAAYRRTLERYQYLQKRYKTTNNS
jgi:tetratricopeptide (TPR) repeat protein